jgi:hypothetical protein
MYKKGQVTVFIILGIVILAFFVTGFFLKDYLAAQRLQQVQEDATLINSKASAVKLFVGSCIGQVGENAILTVGYRGGKEKLQAPYFEEELFDSNYLYYLGNDNSQSRDETEKSLEDLMNEHLLDCVPDDFKSNVNTEIVNPNFLFEGLALDVGEISTTVRINDESTIFTVDWPLKLRMKDMEREITDFEPARFPVRLGKITNFVEEFVGKLVDNPYLIDAFYLVDQNFTIDYGFLNNDTYIIKVTDKESLVNHQPLQYLFAAKIETEGVLI